MMFCENRIHQNIVAHHIHSEQHQIVVKIGRMSSLQQLASETFRDALPTWRDARGVTQAELADAMRKAGFPFHQQTVLKIEQGTRKITLDEAVEISRILDAPLSFLTDDTRVSSIRGLLIAQAEGSTRLYRELHELIERQKKMRELRDSIEFDLTEGVIGERMVPIAEQALHDLDEALGEHDYEAVALRLLGTNGEHPEDA